MRYTLCLELSGVDGRVCFDATDDAAATEHANFIVAWYDPRFWALGVVRDGCLYLLGMTALGGPK